ncbi:UDP-N-acetylmuramate:L-alanyl-gamma-D-glutamyl-meso-diaminopimelate ligase [Nitrogeniibacter aestuarii]|uniref:UDP-N-acetylmuramate:L-alanyl-gamma-D-glutamyl- meso-diaminopimelate ligase n=1 Tax=Nitrogeniibacter aestuarii TaxID=2815343 RepID=UPI001E5AC700|nr:UDP-N-acetylmuramate:L-alanyl-gamma-D-glutamyl-meso-diaminopimelate ligase [Nitrogeniibacter aestuarii]
MHIHILGICGTFMGGLAVLARAAGHTVTGCDANVYPPMSTQLESEGIELTQGYGVEQLDIAPDVFVVGNAISRGNPLLEAILNAGLPYVSGPQWLAEHVLQGKWVLGVAGTHGKTTTSSMLAWLLEDGGLNPGFLIGGVTGNFGVSARLTDSPFFVIEADEYDTAFCDKRSKFVHYRPRTAILNNLEFDHADIFVDLAAIETQFHHLVRIMPGQGRVIANANAPALDRVLERGCWSELERFAGDGGWTATLDADGTGHFAFDGASVGSVMMPMAGEHNLHNALAAIAAARHAGVPAAMSVEALSRFKGVKRRLEVRGTVGGVTVYDDFAHHPTAIALTIDGLRKREHDGRILAVLEPRSNTMKLGVMKAQLPDSLMAADAVFCYAGGVDWDVAGALNPLGAKLDVRTDLDALVSAIVAEARPGDHVLVMSNGGFGGIHQKLLDALA